MMAPEVQDVLSANVVFVGVQLINEPSGFDKFRDSVGSEVIVEGGIVASIQGAVSEPGNLLRLARDRIVLECTSLRSSVKREYPDHCDLERLASVADYAVANTNLAHQKPLAFGFNVEFVYDQSSGNSAMNYLASRLFSPRLNANEHRQLVGGTGKFIFRDGSRKWTFKVEPRFNDEKTTKIFLALNTHVEEPRMPTQDEIHHLLSESWTEAGKFLARID